jgi:hypothetical protein
MSKYFYKAALCLSIFAAAFFLTSYLKKTSVSASLEGCTSKEDARPSEEAAIKGDLFFWESITRNFASIR